MAPLVPHGPLEGLTNQSSHRSIRPQRPREGLRASWNVSDMSPLKRIPKLAEEKGAAGLIHWRLLV